MYETLTYENVLQTMLERIPNDMDKRPGSIIFDALAPAAAELAQAYIALEQNLDLGFADTASGLWLEKRTQELGVYRREAVKSVREATFDIPVDVGERFYIDDVYYAVIEGGTTARVECETAGVTGNDPVSGSGMLPVDYVPGLTSAMLGDVLIPGEEAESDDSLYERYVEQIREPSTSNNQAQLKQWAREVEGVGDAKVFPLWNGDNTAKVVLVDSTGSPASAELVSAVQDHIDPGMTGLGEGRAAIGLFCTVERATSHPIQVSATLVLRDESSLDQAQQEIEAKLEEHCKAIAFEETVVRYAQIGSMLLNAPSVVDYDNLTVNGGTANVILAESEIPVKGTVTLSE